MVLFKVSFCNVPISFHYTVEQIYHLESHEPCISIAEFFILIVFNGFNYLVLEGLLNGYVVFKDSVCFDICLIDLLVVSDCGNYSYCWS